MILIFVIGFFIGTLIGFNFAVLLNGSVLAGDYSDPFDWIDGEDDWED